VAKGESLEQIQKEVGDPEPGPQKPNPAGRRFIVFSQAVYDELTAQKK
jgi:hypothetical protein